LNLGFLTEDLKITRRKLAAVTLLNSGTLAWYFLLIIYMSDIFSTITMNDPFWSYYWIAQTLFLGSAIFWAIIGSFAGGRMNRRRLLISWITLGTLSTILLILSRGTILAAVSSILLGLSMGLGLPSSTALIADYTVAEERARVSGIIILGTFILAFITIAAIRLLDLEISGIIVLFALVRSTSFLAPIIDNCDKPKQESIENRLPSTAYKEFAYYLFPWVVFSITGGLASNLIPQQDYAAAIATGTTLRYVTIAIAGLMSGVAADKIGRKWPIIIGLVVLGASFGLLGFFGITHLNVILYLTLSGVAWGTFFVIYLAVPGDLSVFGFREKFYGIGYMLPIAFLFGLSAIPGETFLVGFSAPSFSQILSFLLFLSIIPMLLAKETLDESKMHERKMKDYLKKLGETIQESQEGK